MSDDPTDGHRREGQHQILQQILALRGRHQWELDERHVREEDEREYRPRNPDEQQEQRDADERPVDIASPMATSHQPSTTTVVSGEPQ